MVQLVRFPPVSNATEDGLLAMGGDLSVDTLVSAYSQGIFPWFNEDQPVLWWSPDPRMVLFPSDVKISRSLRKTMRKNQFTVTCNMAFEQVIEACALRGVTGEFRNAAPTWITTSMHEAYIELHKNHYAHSIEVWLDKELVGGLYGVVLGQVFFGESMFSRVNDASKIALVKLCQWLQHLQFSIIDCQVASDHLYTLGAIEIPRDNFLNHLKNIDIREKSTNFSTGFAHFLRDNDIYKQV